MKKTYLFLSILTVALLTGNITRAQQRTSAKGLDTNGVLSKVPVSKVAFGFGDGFRSGSLRYSNLDEALYPNNESAWERDFAIFMEIGLFYKGNWALRPELAFTHRGGKLTGMYSNTTDATGNNYYEANGIKDLNYEIHARYMDFRLPIMYQFRKAYWSFFPYVYVGPVLSLATGGYMRAQYEYPVAGGHEDSYTYNGYQPAITNGNLSSVNVAVEGGVGVKYRFPNGIFLGLEASYEYGLTDTYGSKEKDGAVTTLPAFFTAPAEVEGTRMFDAFELRVNVGIPLSASLGEKVPYFVVPVVNLEKVVRTDTVVKETLVRDTVMKETVVHDTVRIETPVTLQEANQLIGEGKDISGMTISTFGKAVTFDLDKSVIKPQSYQYLDTLAAMLISTNMHCEVRGHTDNSGTNWHNARLSKDRAVAVVQYLKRKGVNPAKLTYSSYGSTRPVATNDTEEGRSQNRRVEFVITK